MSKYYIEKNFLSFFLLVNIELLYDSKILLKNTIL